MLPRRAAARTSLRAASRRPTAAAAAAPAAPTRQQSSNLVPFARLGSASLLSVDDQVPAAFVAPPATGLPTAPLLVPATPLAYCAGSGDAWQAAATYVDVNAGVADCFGGLDTEKWRQVGRRSLCGGAEGCLGWESVCRPPAPTLSSTPFPSCPYDPSPSSPPISSLLQVAYTHLGNAISALDAAAASLSAPTAASTLRHLCTKAGPALALVAPGGTSALAALPACQLPQLLQRAAACADELTATGCPAAASDTALAALQLLSHLRFGSKAAAEPYAAAACALKAAMAAAACSPAAAISERQVLCLVSACVCADSHLWLTPWVNLRWTAAAEASLTAGWSSGEAAVQYLEGWCALVARGHLHFVPAKFQVAAEAAVGHDQLTTAQLSRLLAAEAALPAHLTTTVNAWLAGWTAGVSARRNALVRAQAKAAAGSAARARHAAARSAAAAVELALGAPALAAVA